MATFARNSCGTSRHSGYQSSEGYVSRLFSGIDSSPNVSFSVGTLMFVRSCCWDCAGKQCGLSGPTPDNAGLNITQVSAKFRLLLNHSYGRIICSSTAASCRQHHQRQLLGLSRTAEPAAEEQSLMCSKKCLLICHDVILLRCIHEVAC